MKQLRIAILLTTLLTATSAVAQDKPKRFDLAVTAGVPGLGIDMGWQATDWMRLRAGFAWMPHWTHDMNFSLQVGDAVERTKWQMADAGDPLWMYKKTLQRTDHFGRMAGYMYDITGIEVDNTVLMHGQPTYWNVKLLADIYPLRNKHWRLTCGLFIGNNKIARAFNATEEMPALLAVDIYNRMYDKAVAGLPIVTVGQTSVYSSELSNMLKSYGRMGIHVGNYTHDIYDEQGTLLHSQGDPYMMVPDENSMAKANVLVNSVKPYIGLGYDGSLTKDGRWTIGIDAGIMLWGGTPKIQTHDGTDLATDVEDIGGKVEDYVKLIKGFKVLPSVELRLSRKIF